MKMILAFAIATVFAASAFAKEKPDYPLTLEITKYSTVTNGYDTTPRLTCPPFLVQS